MGSIFILQQLTFFHSSYISIFPQNLHNALRQGFQQKNTSLIKVPPTSKRFHILLCATLSPGNSLHQLAIGTQREPKSTPYCRSTTTVVHLREGCSVRCTLLAQL